MGGHGLPGLRPWHHTSRKYVSVIQSASKSGVLDRLIITMLARCGDINPNPGPYQSVQKRKYTHKYKCYVCSGGVRARRVHCKSQCGRLAHPKCIDGLTNAIFDIFSVNGETIDHTCNICIHTCETNSNTVIINGDTSNNTSPSGTPLKHIIGLPSGDSGSRECDKRDGGSRNHEDPSNRDCHLCANEIKKNNIRVLCLNLHRYHTRCYKKVNVGDRLCKQCLFNELPFANIDISIENYDNVNDNSVVIPSKVPTNIFDCFKNGPPFHTYECEISV